MFIKDYWNIADIIVILLSIGFILISFFLDGNKALKGFLKIRGVFRLLRVFILIRKLNAVRIRREVRLKTVISNGYDIRSPLEKVMEMLNNIRDALDTSEIKMINDLNYCLKMISTNKLYEADIELED